jgi:predicted transposase/invertase (TIGR01784 family)
MVMKYLDPKADLTFKKIFGNHPKRLISLLNALQSLSEEELIQQQQYLPTVEELEISGFTDAELRAYDKFWDSVSVERTLLDDRYQKGKEEGKAEGKHEANTETAQRLLAMGLSAEEVAKATQLPLEIIKKQSNL